jgi:hypothetical protein
MPFAQPQAGFTSLVNFNGRQDDYAPLQTAQSFEIWDSHPLRPSFILINFFLMLPGLALGIAVYFNSVGATNTLLRELRSTIVLFLNIVLDACT